MLKEIKMLFDKNTYGGKFIESQDFAFCEFPECSLSNVKSEVFPFPSLVLNSETRAILLASSALLVGLPVHALSEPRDFREYVSSYSSAKGWSEYWQTGQVSNYHKRILPLLGGASLIAGCILAYPMISQRLSSSATLHFYIRKHLVLKNELLLERDLSKRLLKRSTVLVDQLQNNTELIRKMQKLLEVFIADSNCMKIGTEQYMLVQLFKNRSIWENQF